jgi:hypothetical protein
MGIRFACHQCGKRLNIKSDLAGRRGVCPACSARFRIPLHDAEESLPVEQKPDAIASSPAVPNPSPPSKRHASGAPETPTGTASPVDAVTPQRPESSASAPANNATFAIEQGVGEPPAGEDSPVSNPAAARRGAVDALSEHEPEAIWYVRPPTGNQYGPASTELLRQWIDEDRVAATALLWRDGWPQWRAAAEALPELADSLPGGGESAGPSGEPFAGAAPTQSRPSQSTTRDTVSAVDLAGQATVGAERRVRSLRRVMWIGILAAVALLLVGLLAVVANRG